MPARRTAPRAVSRSVVVAAPPQRVFALLSDPRAHVAFDGSGTVRSVVSGPEQLYLGARFTVRMRRGVRYVIRNTVVEYERDHRIAWRHIGRHRWRYELAPSGDGTLVTETFDYSTAWTPRLLERLRYPEANAKAIDATLARLRVLMSAPVEPSGADAPTQDRRSGAGR
jgi:uncharacterized protein YndB with AHSA1/START domain